MGEDGAGIRHESSLGGCLPADWRLTVQGYIERLKEVWPVRCVVLHGSYATGKWIHGSDVDLVIIAEGLPASFHDRLAALSGLRPRGVPLEALAYTPQEFDKMLESMHVTALDTTSRGVALSGEAYFSELKSRTQDMIKRGLRRGAVSWYWEKHGG